jgi:hypothetical protein
VVWFALHELQLDREHRSFEDPARREATRRIGESLVKQLEAFREGHGGYPRSLEEAVDVDHPSFAPLAGGLHWHYEVDEARQQFRLAFGVGSGPYPCESYSSDDRRWRIDR